MIPTYHSAHRPSRVIFFRYRATPSPTLARCAGHHRRCGRGVGMANGATGDGVDSVTPGDRAGTLDQPPAPALHHCFHCKRSTPPATAIAATIQSTRDIHHTAFPLRRHVAGRCEASLSLGGTALSKVPHDYFLSDLGLSDSELDLSAALRLASASSRHSSISSKCGIFCGSTWVSESATD